MRMNGKSTRRITKSTTEAIQGQLEQANISFDMALKEDFFGVRTLKENTPGNPKIQLELALQFFDKNIESEPKNPKAWIKKGIALYIAGKSTEAQSNFEKAIQIEPNYAKVWNG